MKSSITVEVDQMRVLDIQFVGGPYDGHQECCFAHPSQLPIDVVWFFGERAFRSHEDCGHVPIDSGGTVALYALKHEAEVYRYRFVGAIPANQLA